MHAFRWSGTAMEPLKPKAADHAFVIGQVYWLDEVSERSWVSHQHQFAWLKTAWENLPEQLSDTFPTPEHLRKAALIATGWNRETIITAGSAMGARSFAAFARHEDAFAHIRISGKTVVVRQARSQRRRGPDAMSKSEFQKSKDDILGWVANLTGVDADALRRAA